MLDEKINTHFAGNVVRKDLTKIVKGNAIVPSYVLEYLLGQFCATDDQESIEVGIEKVKDILAKHMLSERSWKSEVKIRKVRRKVLIRYRLN